MAKNKGLIAAPTIDTDFKILKLIELRTKHGYSTPSIIKYCLDEWGHSTSYSYALYAKAKMRIGEMYHEMNDNALIDSVLLMENMIEKALENDSPKLALEVLKELNKCNNLYLQKIELLSDKPVVVNIVKSKQ